MRMLIVAAALAATLTGCHHKGEANRGVAQAWVRLPAVPDRPGAGYFTLEGVGQADRLVAVQSAVVRRIELHQGGMSGGMMTMRPLAGIDVPASGTIRFAPEGNHAMLFGIDPAIVPGTAIPMRFLFGSGRTVEAEAKTVAAGGDAPY